MLKTRVIPCLLLQNQGLVKTVRFKNPAYVGDPINAVKIFNEKEVDELIFLDIQASKENLAPNLGVIRDIASECFMPFCYGGGIRTVADMMNVFSVGAEKVSVNSLVLKNPGIIDEAAGIFGSQSIVVSLDVKKNMFGRHKVYDTSKSKTTDRDVVEYAVEMERRGAGELLVTSVDRDGTMEGYDLELVKKIAHAVSIPVIACGGAGRLEHFAEAVKHAGASAVAAGSMFVFYGKHRAVLINYPDVKELEKLFL